MRGLVFGFLFVLVFWVTVFCFTRADILSQADMQEIETFTSDVKLYEGRSKVFWFALQKIKANPSNYEAILKSLNLWEKL